MTGEQDYELDRGYAAIIAGHAHDWERGAHMAEAFGRDGRRYACALCGLPRDFPPQERTRITGQHHEPVLRADSRCLKCNPEPVA